MSQQYSDVILLSGGVDSAFLAVTVPPEIRPGLALFVDYGQPAAKMERRAATVIAERMYLDFKVVNVDGMPLGDMGQWQSGAAVVPARNLWLISIAAAFGKTVWIGASPEDHADYDDCRPVFLDHLSLSMGRGCGGAVKYSTATRNHRVGILRKRGVDVLAWSCYSAGPEPCGQCASCSQ